MRDENDQINYKFEKDCLDIQFIRYNLILNFRKPLLINCISISIAQRRFPLFYIFINLNNYVFCHTISTNYQFFLSQLATVVCPQLWRSRMQSCITMFFFYQFAKFVVLLARMTFAVQSAYMTAPIQCPCVQFIPFYIQCGSRQTSCYYTNRICVKCTAAAKNAIKLTPLAA